MKMVVSSWGRTPAMNSKEKIIKSQRPPRPNNTKRKATHAFLPIVLSDVGVPLIRVKVSTVTELR